MDRTANPTCTNQLGFILAVCPFRYIIFRQAHGSLDRDLLLFLPSSCWCVMAKRIKQFYRFGPFRIDLEDRLLLRDGEIVTLTPKSFDLLLFLIENRGRLLDKEALMTGVWPGVCVEESNLSKNIFLLRKSLGDRADGKP